MNELGQTYTRNGITYWRKPEELQKNEETNTVPVNGAMRFYLGDTLRTVRTEKNLTLREVKDQSHVSLGYVSEVERGRKEVSSEFLEHICSSMDIKMSEVLRMTADKLEKIGK